MHMISASDLPPIKVMICAGKAIARAVILSEDFDAAEMALKACDIIQMQAGDGLCLRRNLWKIQALEVPEIRDLAAASAAAADLVLISASGRRRPSQALRRWVQLWLSLKGNSEQAMLALFPRDSHPELSGWHRWPRSEIKGHHISFFMYPQPDTSQASAEYPETDTCQFRTRRD